MTPELLAKIAIWRQKAIEGTLTIDDQREAIAVMRDGRLGASVSSDQARRAKAKKTIRSAEDLLGELGL